MGWPASPAQADVASDFDCRFGVTAPLGIVGYESKFDEAGACATLDWGSQRPASLPAEIEYLHVLRVRDDLYPGVLSNLDTLVPANPGAVWEIGNEPDTCYEQQDCVDPETYAARYQAIANQIRNLDATAEIGFGTIVQPTPLRLRYLERAWLELVSLEGSQSNASALIDFWNVHSFILNEWPGEWGTGVPLGFTCDTDIGQCWDEGASPDCTANPDLCWAPVHYTNYPYNETHDNSIFNARVMNLRQWMADVGERAKPLWITEYGSLFPPIDPPGGPDLVNVSDQETARFMLESFDFLLNAVDAGTGFPPDGNRLVQRWYWYSLNEYRYKFGGSLYDPDNGGAITLVGTEFKEFVNFLADTPGVFRDGMFYLRNANNDGYANLGFGYGLASDTPLNGDWNGDGINSIGIRRNEVFHLRNSNSAGFADLVFAYGIPGDLPVVGDWDGDGMDTVGIYRDGVFHLRNSNTPGPADLSFTYGMAGDVPLAGDWDDDGVDSIGIFRGGVFYLRNANTAGNADLTFAYGMPNDIPLCGDWDGDATDTIGIHRNGIFYLRDSNTPGAADRQFSYGASSDTPLTGNWDGIP